ncbi:hypothetical protein JOC77_001003 [Peribacillus deserti]|uniref:Multidrug transporter n=1 Tax=Peribacillus deserti TaxID=673318 RepID=A0ABS2QEL3_9BACI|nr:hypothetical protein [Peribacillus deserti]MBM7691596.1 hypothetical protein [Peribacillus deserti]
MQNENQPEQQADKEKVNASDDNREQNESEPAFIIAQGDPNLSPDAGRPLI